MNVKYLRRLTEYRNTMNLALLQVETIRGLRADEGDTAAVAALDTNIAERKEHLAKLASQIADARKALAK